MSESCDGLREGDVGLQHLGALHQALCRAPPYASKDAGLATSNTMDIKVLKSSKPALSPPWGQWRVLASG